MCGITGFIDFTHQSNYHTLTRMTDALVHRGPDDSGYDLFKTDKALIGMGHRRLSILDLSPLGHQPMKFEHLSLVLNGEIYNFKEIRRELESLNYRFISDSDTEVMLKAYHKWGIECLHRFIGMFACAIYDSNSQKMILARDRTGIKPLYWYFHHGLFMFASELKSFHEHPDFCKQIDCDSLSLFLKYGYILEPNSIFQHTKKMMSGHFLEIDIFLQTIRETVYWNVLDYYNKSKIKICETDAIDELERLLKSACEYRMVADVPVGIFLSGGYDSSIVTALLQSNRTEPLKTFTLGFHEKKFNEAPFAKEVADYLETDHTEYYCRPEDVLDILPLLPEIYDEPFGDKSAIPTTLISRISRQKVKVCLSADGGDELFGGYKKYQQIKKKMGSLSNIPAFAIPALRACLNSLSVQKLAQKSGMKNTEKRMETLALRLGADGKTHLSSDTIFTQSEIDLLFRECLTSPCTNFNNDIKLDWLSNLLATDYKTYLIDDILAKVDRATMSVSLEGREPLLDHRLIEFSARLPNNYKINKNEKKWILKKIAHKYLPEKIMNRPKMGFSVPALDWFKKDALTDYLMTYLNETQLNKSGFFNPEPVIQMRQKYLSGDTTSVTRLWFLLIFEMWRERWG